MAGPDTPSVLSPCPSDEEIAAFLDATLSAEEHAQIVAHLAHCVTCLEVFAAVVHVLSELAKPRL